MTDPLIKSPRLYVTSDLKNAGETFSPGDDQHHYIHRVMRLSAGDSLRVFNGRHGEWQADIKEIGKKSVVLELVEQRREQSTAESGLHLFFSPLKKARMDMVIEKAVELGVEGLHPVMMRYTQSQDIKRERIEKQIREAAEQCERLSLPVLHDPVPFAAALQLMAEYEDAVALVARREVPPLWERSARVQTLALLIGPEGGFASEELGMLEKHEQIAMASLGAGVLRAETACIAALSQSQCRRQDQ